MTREWLNPPQDDDLRDTEELFLSFEPYPAQERPALLEVEREFPVEVTWVFNNSDINGRESIENKNQYRKVLYSLNGAIDSFSDFVLTYCGFDDDLSTERNVYFWQSVKQYVITFYSNVKHISQLLSSFNPEDQAVVMSDVLQPHWKNMFVRWQRYVHYGNKEITTDEQGVQDFIQGLAAASTLQDMDNSAELFSLHLQVRYEPSAVFARQQEEDHAYDEKRKVLIYDLCGTSDPWTQRIKFDESIRTKYPALDYFNDTVSISDEEHMRQRYEQFKGNVRSTIIMRIVNDMVRELWKLNRGSTQYNEKVKELKPILSEVKKLATEIHDSVGTENVIYTLEDRAKKIQMKRDNLATLEMMKAVQKHLPDEYNQLMKTTFLDTVRSVGIIHAVRIAARLKKA